jgi:hypothetical protein
MLSLRRFVTVAAPMACAAILMCSGAALGQFHGDGVSDPPVPEGPAAPTEFVAHPGNDTVLLQWNPSTGAVGYKVYRSLTSGGGFQPIGTTEDEWYPDNNVDNGTTYYYKVRASDSYNRQGPPTPEQEAEPLADYPTIAITDPTGGTVEGTIDVEMSAEDLQGASPGIMYAELLVDGMSQGAVVEDQPTCSWPTFTDANGEHILQAITRDCDSNKGYGVPVRVSTDTFISEVAASSPEVSPNGDGEDDTVTITAALTESTDWIVRVESLSGGLVVDFEGTGTEVSATWDGMAEGGGGVDDGIYKYKVWVDKPPPTRSSGTLGAVLQPTRMSRSWRARGTT